MVAPRLLRLQAGGKAKMRIWTEGLLGKASPQVLVPRNSTSSFEYTEVPALMPMILGSSSVVLAKAKTSRRRQASWDSQGPKATGRHRVATLASTNKRRTHTPSEARPSRLSRRQSRPVPPASPEDIGDSAMSFPPTGSDELDHVLTPFARAPDLARATSRPTSQACPTTRIVTTG